MFQFFMGFTTCLILLFLYSVIVINKDKGGEE